MNDQSTINVDNVILLIVLIRLKKIALTNSKKVSVMQDLININDMKFMCFINQVQLSMLNAFTVSHMSAVNALTFLFVMLLASAMSNIVMQSLKPEFRALLMSSVQSSFTINQNYQSSRSFKNFS